MTLFSAQINNRYYLINKFSKIWIFFSFIVQLLFFVFPIAQKGLLYTMPAFTLIFFIVWLIRFDYLKSPTFILGVIFVCWYFLTRIILGEKFYPGFYLYFFEIATAYLFFLPFAFNSEDYKEVSLFDLLSHLIVFFISLMGLLGDISAVFQITIKIPGIDYITDMTSWNGRLEVFEINPNVVAMLLIVALMLAIYLILKHRSNRTHCILLFVCFIICYWALVLTACRGAEYGLVFSAPFISVLLFDNYLKKAKKKFILKFILIILSFVITFYSFSWTATILSGISNLIADSKVTSVENIDSTIDSESTDETFVQDRESTSLSGLNGRTDIYKSFFEYSKTHKNVYLYGMKERSIQLICNKYITESHSHLHCSFLQTMALTGVLGLTLVLAIIVITFIHSLKVYFSKELSLSERFIPVILIPMIIHACVESYLFVPAYEFSYMMFENNFFLLVSGYVIAKGMNLKSGKEK